VGVGPEREGGGELYFDTSELVVSQKNRGATGGGAAPEKRGEERYL